MKKYPVKLLIPTLMLVLILGACQEEASQLEEMELIPSTTTLSVEEARTWFETEYLALIESANQTEESFWNRYQKQPEWDKARTSHLANEAVVELPLSFPDKRPGFTLEGEGIPEDNKASTFFRLVIAQNGAGEMEAKLMTIMGDFTYLREGKTELTDNTYLEKTDDFSGQVLFHDWNGKFLHGEVYEAGSQIAHLEEEMRGGRGSEIASRDVHCRIITLNEYTMVCTDWYVNGEHVSTDCGEWEVTGSTTYTACDESPAPTGGGGSSSNNGQEDGEKLCEESIWWSQDELDKNLATQFDNIDFNISNNGQCDLNFNISNMCINLNRSADNLSYSYASNLTARAFNQSIDRIKNMNICNFIGDHGSDLEGAFISIFQEELRDVLRGVSSLDLTLSPTVTNGSCDLNENINYYYDDPITSTVPDLGCD